MGAVLQQRVEDFSRKLSPAQKSYIAYDREVLAIYEAVKFSRNMLVARHFTILTEDKHLHFAFHQKKDKCLRRQLNHLAFIFNFTTDIRHISG